MNTDTSIPSFVTDWVNLADPRLGARALAASDEFFAPKEEMLNPAPAVFVADKYTPLGKWMDGWETRRRRGGGHDWCILRLGLPGIIQGFDLDTSHFTGNYPQAASIEACYIAADDPGPNTRWTRLLPPTTLKGNTHHYLVPAGAGADEVWTHLRLNIFPDGGVARLRVYGKVACDWSARSASELYDLAAVQNGGRAVACNDAHFGRPSNMLAPGRGVNMGDGWETRRRREPGNDWAIIELGHAGRISRIEIDTAHFKGNYPDRCSIQAAPAGSVSAGAVVAQSMFWPLLLPEQPLSADTVHEFSQLADVGAVSHIRLNIIPDGGVSRVRVWGHPQT